MVPFNLQIELNSPRVTLSAEQLDQLADETGFIRYQVRAFDHNSVVYVNIEEEPLSPGDVVGFSEDEVFTLDEVKTIAAAIRQYNSSRKLNFDQCTLTFIP
jgi:hypothetical protein